MKALKREKLPARGVSRKGAKQQRTQSFLTGADFKAQMQRILLFVYEKHS